MLKNNTKVFLICANRPKMMIDVISDVSSRCVGKMVNHKQAVSLAYAVKTYYDHILGPLACLPYFNTKKIFSLS